MFKQVFFICILLLTPVHSRRSSGGGSFSSSRGSSGARAGVAPGGFNPQSNQGFHPQPNSGFHPQPNPGFQPNQGGFRPQPNQGFNGQHSGGFNQGPHMPAGGFNNNRGFGGGTSHFVPGNGMGSAKSGSSFKTALAGAALGTIGGLAAFEIGKAIISSASTPIHHNNKDYYWGQEYHQQKPGEIRCAMPLNDLIQNVPVETTTAASGATTVATDVTTTPPPNQLLSQLQFANGTRPKEIVWSCKQGTEVCCGTDCCAAPVQQNNNMNNPNGASSQGGSGSSIFGIILGVLLVIALLACCCCFAVYKLCRSSLDSCLPSSNRHEEHYYEDGQKYEGPSYGNSYPLQPTQYSNQPYSNQPYPQQQQQYPQPQQYPDNPNQQGYYNQQKY